MEHLHQMPNIGAVMEQQLQEVGIHTPEELRKAGSKEAWLRILAQDPSACINRLMGLEGAIRGVRWHHLEETAKEDLRRFYKQAKGKEG